MLRHRFSQSIQSEPESRTHAIKCRTPAPRLADRHMARQNRPRRGNACLSSSSSSHLHLRPTCRNMQYENVTAGPVPICRKGRGSSRPRTPDVHTSSNSVSGVRSGSVGFCGDPAGLHSSTKFLCGNGALGGGTIRYLRGDEETSPWRTLVAHTANACKLSLPLPFFPQGMANSYLISRAFHFIYAFIVLRQTSWPPPPSSSYFARCPHRLSIAVHPR